MNIAELLKKYAKKGDEFYSLMTGVVKYDGMDDDEMYPIVMSDNTYMADGRYAEHGEYMLFPSKDQRDWQKWVEEKAVEENIQKLYQVGDHVLFNGEELGVVTDANSGVFTVLDVKYDDFVELEQNLCNENLKKIDHFDYNSLKIFGPVLVRDNGAEPWCISHFSHIDANGIYCENRCHWLQCIPFNAETEKLHNTADKAPEFYNVKIG